MTYIDDSMFDLNKGKAPEKKRKKGEMMTNEWAEPKIDIVNLTHIII